MCDLFYFLFLFFLFHSLIQNAFYLECTIYTYETHKYLLFFLCRRCFSITWLCFLPSLISYKIIGVLLSICIMLTKVIWIQWFYVFIYFILYNRQPHTTKPKIRIQIHICYYRIYECIAGHEVNNTKKGNTKTSWLKNGRYNLKNLVENDFVPMFERLELIFMHFFVVYTRFFTIQFFQ